MPSSSLVTLNALQGDSLGLVHLSSWPLVTAFPPNSPMRSSTFLRVGLTPSSAQAVTASLSSATFSAWSRATCSARAFLRCSRWRLLVRRLVFVLLLCYFYFLFLVVIQWVY